MNQTLRVLMVEDSEDDANLLLHVLRREGYEVVYEVVDTPSAMRAALERQDWDVITSDHAMPHFSAPAALALAKELRPSLPFLILSGEIDLNLAVSLMKGGAQDYIQKRELRRIVPAIERELKEAESIIKREQAEEALRESEERYRTLVENASDVVYRTDENGYFIFVNPAALSITGYKEDEIIGKHYKMLFRSEMFKEAIKFFANQIINKIKNTYYECPIIAKDGHELWIGQNTQLIMEDDHVAGFQAVARDITERKRAEEELLKSEEKYRTILENIEDGYFEVDLAGNFTFFNPSLCRILGYPREEMPGMNNRVFMDAENAKNVFQAFNEIYVTGIPHKGFEWETIRKDGARTYIEVSVSLILKPGEKPTGFRGIARDVTERKRAAKVLRESEDLFRSLVEYMHDAVIILNWDGAILFANQAAARIIEYEPPEELVGHNMVEYLHPDSLQKAAEDLEAVKADKMGFLSEYQLRSVTGRHVWVESIGGKIVFRNATANLVCIRDITDRKRTEEALHVSEERFRLLSEAAFEAIAIHEEGVLLNANEQYFKMFGYEPDEALGKEMISVTIAPESIELAKKQIAIDGLGPYESIGLRKDGTRFPMEVRVRKMDYKGHNVRFAAIREITDRKQVEKALQTSKAQLSNALEIAHLGHWEYDIANDLFTFNDQIYKIFRTSVEQVGGYTMHSAEYAHRFVHPDDINLVVEETRKAIETTDPNFNRQIEHRMLYADGTVGYITVRFFIIKDSHGRTIKTYGVNQDITKRKRVEEEIQQLNRTLEQRVSDRTAQLEIANKELEAFSYSVSHDLKAPLRAIDGYAQILIEDHAVRLDGEGRRTCEVISNNALKMGRLIDALLTLSRTGRMEMNPAPIDMAAMANAVFFQLTTPEARERIDFHVGSLPRVVGDPTLLRQVWVNLIGNAVKFAAQKERAVIEVGCLSEANGYPPAGGHEADVSTEHLHLPSAIPIPDSKRVYFVRDNGAGFDMAYVDKLFGVFQRLHSAKEFEGTGAGLAIVQQIVQRHGGRIWAEGEVGKGATFYFSMGKA